MRESWTDERLDDLNAKVHSGFRRADDRFAHIDERFDEADRRFDEVDRRIIGIDRRLDRFEGQFGRIDERIDSLGKIITFGFISMTGAIVACFAALLPQV